MRYFFCVFLLFLSSAGLLSQSNAISINTMPLSLTNRFARARLGMEVETPQLIYCLDLEFGNERTGFTSFARNYQFFGIRPELKYRRNGSTSFFALEVPITRRTHFLEDGTFERTTGTRLTFESATQKRTRTSLILKYGRKRLIGNFAYINIYMGLGVVRRKVTYQQVVNPAVATEEPTKEWGLSSDETPEGIRVLPDAVLGVKIGVYLFRW